MTLAVMNFIHWGSKECRPTARNRWAFGQQQLGQDDGGERDDHNGAGALHRPVTAAVVGAGDDAFGAVIHLKTWLPIVKRVNAGNQYRPNSLAPSTMVRPRLTTSTAMAEEAPPLL